MVSVVSASESKTGLGLVRNITFIERKKNFIDYDFKRVAQGALIKWALKSYM